MGVIDQLKVFECELLDVLDLTVELEVWERMRQSLELLLQRLHMVRVDVGVPKHMNEFASLETADLCKHAGKQRIARDIEWNAETQVTAALVHLAAQLIAARHVELSHDVTGGQCHLAESGRIPSCQHQTTGGRIIFQSFD